MSCQISGNVYSLRHHMYRCRKYDFVLKMGILYVDFYFVYVEGPKADELSLIGFTFVK